MIVPGGHSGALAELAALKEIRHRIRKDVNFGAFGRGVYGAGLGVLGQDRAEVLCGRVFVAPVRKWSSFLAADAVWSWSASLVKL